MQTIDWLIVAGFGVLLAGIVVYTNRITRSVAGFLSSERCAGRYLLTIANSMAFCSAIGIVAGYEGAYQNGITNLWWGMLMMPVGTILALTGWVTYRYRQTRSLTMAEFLEKRYNRRFRIFAGFVAFFSGLLNCAVFPLVTAHFLVFFFQFPPTFTLAGVELSTHFCVMLVMVSLGVTLAVSGGQITIMVTDFFQGTIGTFALLSMIGLLIFTVGWSDLMTTLKRSEDVRVLQTDQGEMTYPKWYRQRVAPIREHHAAMEQQLPGIFAAIRSAPAVLDALGKGYDAARQLAETQREAAGETVYEVDLQPEDFAANAALADALAASVPGVAQAAQASAAEQRQAGDAVGRTAAEWLEALVSTGQLDREVVRSVTRDLRDAAATGQNNPYATELAGLQGVLAMSDADGPAALVRLDELRRALRAKSLAIAGRRAGVLERLAEQPELIVAAGERFKHTRLLVAKKYPDMMGVLERAEGASMMNPAKLGNEGPFSVPFFIMQAIITISLTGVWQGGSGYLTAARTPHEGRMGGILGGWRWMTISLGGVAVVMLVYCTVWNQRFAEEQQLIMAAAQAIDDPLLQRQQFVSTALAYVIPAGLMGLYVVFMIGASISTDDSAYHSWGSIFLQDVVMPFRKEPFTTQQHLLHLRLAIVGVGVFALVFSSFWRLTDYINMWFQITGAIYTGGAACAIVGGLYWKRGTTAGAFAGLITGSSFSLFAIYFLNRIQNTEVPYTIPRWVPALGDEPINGLHCAVFNVFLSITVYAVVSWLTCRRPANLDRLLHRGDYLIDDDRSKGVEPKREQHHARRVLRYIGVTDEFSRFDIFLYCLSITWTALMSTTFLSVTGWFLFFQSDEARDASAEAWYTGWAWFLGVQAGMAVLTGIWFFLGGSRDLVRLVRAVRSKDPDEADDGYVRQVASDTRD
ncbi:MAG: hypothetical protein AAF750_03340 [Planctomycetota bacterium]